MSENKKYLENLNTELKFYSRQLDYIKDQFKDNTEEDIHNITESLHHLLEEAESAFSKLKRASKSEWEPVKQISMEAFSQLRASFEEFLHDTSEQAQEYASQFKEYSEERLEDLGDYISRNPFKSVLIAAGLGFIIGKLLK